MAELTKMKIVAITKMVLIQGNANLYSKVPYARNMPTTLEKSYSIALIWIYYDSVFIFYCLYVEYDFAQFENRTKKKAHKIRFVLYQSLSQA
jgi:hypothetical protein